MLILRGSVIKHGLSGQSWLTFRKALGLGGHVRKGERGTTYAVASPGKRTSALGGGR